ncbi:MAG TPA: AraC family ligand binding domain-containing protein, partial [Cytophagales bacterium]|nr:AraC family ligand binding domain-containing protein [Cytophagales bacterium]
MSELPIYDIEAFQKGASSFYANDLRIHLQSHLFINTPHSHSTYIVVLFTKGTGLHHIDFETYQVTPWTV